METPKTFKELFTNTGIEPTTDESGNTHYNFKAVMKDTLGKEFYESADKTIKVTKQETLEEVAHKMLINYGIKSMGQSIGILEVKKLMVNFAKWQQERMYSEEEVDLLGKLIKYNERQWDLFDKGIIKIKPKSYDEVIEDFKSNKV